MIQLSALILSLLPAAQEGGGAPPPTPVVAVRAVERSVAPRIRVTGSLMPLHDARLTARETGPIEGEVPRAGTLVKKGDVIARLDPRRLEAERRRLSASLEEASANLEAALAEEANAALDLESLRAARERDSVSAREVRTAEARERMATAQVGAARARREALGAERDLVEVRLADTRIVAPFDGAVVERFAETGEWVVPGTAVVRLVSTGSLEATLDAPERLLGGAAALSEPLSVTVDATGAVVSAVDPRVVPEVSAASRSFRVMADLRPAADAPPLAPGMSISSWLPSGPAAPAIIVPKNALAYRPTGPQITVVKGPEQGAEPATKVIGTAVTLPVQIAFELENEVALRPGPVAAGDVVVTEGNERLFPGMPVDANIEAPEASDNR